MNRRIRIWSMVTVIILVLAGTSGPAFGAPRLESFYGSWIVADGINLGCRMNLTDSWKLIFNLDMCTRSAYLTSSAIYMHRNPVFVLTAGYLGAGISYELQEGKFYPNLLAGAEFGAAFAEYEWMPSPKNYGKVRCGLRARF